MVQQQPPTVDADAGPPKSKADDFDNLDYKLGAQSKETQLEVEHLEGGEKISKWEEYQQLGLCEDDARFLAAVTPSESRKIYRKVDYRVVPMLALLYLISHLDRANIG